MFGKLAFVATLIAALLLGGCASVPNSTFSYSLPETRMSLAVSRTVRCIGGNQIIFGDTVIPTVSQVRGSARSFNTGIMNGDLADTQITIDYHANGTLKGINAENTGAGQAIVTASVKFADIFLPSTAMSFDEQPDAGQIAALCTLIDGQKDKVLTLQYQSSVSLEDGGVSMLRPAANSRVIAANYPLAIPKLCAVVGHSTVPAAPFATADGKASTHSIPLREPGLADVDVRAFWSTKPQTELTICPLKGLPIWEGSVIATQAGVDYGLPIPAPPVFGKTAFSFTLTESGALEKLRFGKTNGVADAIDGASTALGVVQGSTTTEQTQAINDEIALIKARQKLEECQRDPAECD